MIYTIFSLLFIAVALYTLSFFYKDRFKHLEEQMEQLSLSSMQETYQLKKKIRILEEELLAEDLAEPFIQKPVQQVKPKKSNTPPLLKQVQDMNEQGFSTSEIAEKTSLSEHDIRSLINQFSNPSASKGDRFQ